MVSFLIKDTNPSFKIIPVGKSRFYRYESAICDNYLIHDSIVEPIAHKYGLGNPLYFKYALSINGQLIYDLNSVFMSNWFNKIYDDDTPIFKNWIKDGFAYPNAGTTIFRQLEKKIIKDEYFINFVRNKNSIKSIDVKNQIIHTVNESFEYDKIISTVPRDFLFKLCGIEAEFKSHDLHTCVVDTSDLDFEGASELLVTDQNIKFYKVTKLKNTKYQFYFIEDPNDVKNYLSNFMRRFNVISGTCVPNAIAYGQTHDNLLPDNIITIGSGAQWSDLVSLNQVIRDIHEKCNKSNQ